MPEDMIDYMDEEIDDDDEKDYDKMDFYDEDNEDDREY